MTIFKNNFYLSLLSSETPETMEMGIRIMMCQSAKHPCEESLGKIKAKDVELFRKGSVHELYRLKAWISV